MATIGMGGGGGHKHGSNSRPSAATGRKKCRGQQKRPDAMVEMMEMIYGGDDIQ